MYRLGIPSPAIAAAAGVTKSTVRYLHHHYIAAQEDPPIRDEHRAAAGAAFQPSGAGLRNTENIIVIYRTEGRLPTFEGTAPRERALAVWLQRKDADRGALSPPED